jgi:hypothetical protein
MTLKHDPSAIRYVSTQEAYGTTWTLDSIASDGAQTWKNAKGHTALVHKAAAEVRKESAVWVFDGADDKVDFALSHDQKTEPFSISYTLPVKESLTAAPVWKLIDIGQTKEQLDNMVQKPISSDRRSTTVTIFTNVAVSHNGQLTDAYSYDRCLTNEEIRSIWNKGHGSVPGGKKIIQ